MAGIEDTADEELMLRYCAGDAGAFEVLYRRHKGGLYRFVLRQCRNPGVAEELFQEVWMNVVRARDRYTVSARFSTYLYTIAHNRLIDHFRRGAGVSTVSLDDDEDGGEGAALQLPAAEHQQPDHQVDAGQRVARFKALLEALPFVQKEAFLLQEEGGLSVEAIAAATGVNRETAKSRLRYAVAKLRDGMKEFL